MNHLRAAGFSVETETVKDAGAAAASRGVPAAIRSCHTATIGGYVVEGHVPASVIRHLLAQRRKIAGIGVAGMPAGSPGMESPQPVPYQVIAWRQSGETFVYAKVASNGSVTY